MTANDIRQKYLDFFASKGHAVIPSAPLVPENDPTTLFTGSGMQPLLPYLLGKDHPKGKRVADSQKSFRAGDIEEVGDNRHTTFFEMLGNWSLGDYFKQEQLPWFFEFLTKEVGLDPNKLYVTTFIGDEKYNLPRDDESAEIWKKLFAGVGIDAKPVEIGSEEDGYTKGMQGGRIFYYDAKKNWWSRAGVPENMPVGEPGGPDSEVFYDFGTEHDTKWGEHCHPNCDCGRFLEIGNSVFMQYIKKEDGSFALLPKQNVDFGGGLERIAAAKNENPDVFKVDLLWKLIDEIQKVTGRPYEENKKAYRVIADHLRAAVFLIADGVLPSNKDQGYFVRRLLRRSVLFLDKLRNTSGSFFAIGASVHVFADLYKNQYPEIDNKKEEIDKIITEEETRFKQTLELGLKEFNKVISSYVRGDGQSHEDAKKHETNVLESSAVYRLFTTFGFPLELIQEEAAEKGITVDEAGFRMEMEKHQELSRAGAEQKFKGGLADASEQTTRLHTAHHLLLKALQQVLGPHVHQRGSNITAERLRIDFSHGEKMTDEQKKEVERIVNEKIAEALPVTRVVMPKDDAEKLGAEHEFGAKYPDMVSVYAIGPKGASESDPHFTESFSIEFCGGPHATNTADLAGHFSIQKEEAVASGVRRIKAVLK